MHWGSYRLIVSSIFAFAFHHVDGCGRTPARQKPTPTTPSPAGKTTRGPGGPPSTQHTNHYQLKCTKEEVKKAGCLNGGSCFALFLVDVRSAHCRCVGLWEGVRCERIDGNIFVLPANQFQIAGIATGVAALVIILTIIITLLIVRKRRRRMKRQRERNQNNGYVCKSLIPDGTNNVEYSPPYDHNFMDKSETNV